VPAAERSEPLTSDVRTNPGQVLSITRSPGRSCSCAGVVAPGGSIYAYRVHLCGAQRVG